jgi:tetratricopeptide (TPR) repeat protein
MPICCLHRRIVNQQVMRKTMRVRPFKVMFSAIFMAAAFLWIAVPPLGAATKNNAFDVTVQALWLAELKSSAAVKKPVKRPKPSKEKAVEKTVAKTMASKDTAAYWMDRGGLCATYGGYKAAVWNYRKAIKIDPMNAGAYFWLGVAYAELGRYDKALKQIDKAIELDSENGEYYYGRGRVLLLSGESVRAMSDFEKAASFGDADAAHFIKHISHR